MEGVLTIFANEIGGRKIRNCSALAVKGGIEFKTIFPLWHFKNSFINKLTQKKEEKPF